MFGVFSSTGQSCIAGSRLFVERGIYDSFVAKLVAATERLRIGHPFHDTTQVAPLIRPRHREEVESHVRTAREDGGKILTGGERPAGADYADGTYYRPTIVAGLDNTSRLCREEVFGPVLAVLPFDSEADLIRQSNDNSYGLACGIYTRDFPKAWRVARTIDTGTCGSTPTSSFRSRRRSAAPRTAASAARRAATASGPGWRRNRCIAI